MNSGTHIIPGKVYYIDKNTNKAQNAYEYFLPNKDKVSITNKKRTMSQNQNNSRISIKKQNPTFFEYIFSCVRPKSLISDELEFQEKSNKHSNFNIVELVEKEEKKDMLKGKSTKETKPQKNAHKFSSGQVTEIRGSYKSKLILNKLSSKSLSKDGEMRFQTNPIPDLEDSEFESIKSPYSKAIRENFKEPITPINKAEEQTYIYHNKNLYNSNELLEILGENNDLKKQPTFKPNSISQEDIQTLDKSNSKINDAIKGKKLSILALNKSNKNKNQNKKIVIDTPKTFNSNSYYSGGKTPKVSPSYKQKNINRLMMNLSSDNKIERILTSGSETDTIKEHFIPEENDINDHLAINNSRSQENNGYGDYITLKMIKSKSKESQSRKSKSSFKYYDINQTFDNNNNNSLKIINENMEYMNNMSDLNINSNISKNNDFDNNDIEDYKVICHNDINMNNNLINEHPINNQPHIVVVDNSDNPFDEVIYKNNQSLEYRYPYRKGSQNTIRTSNFIVEHDEERNPVYINKNINNINSINEIADERNINNKQVNYNNNNTQTYYTLNTYSDQNQHNLAYQHHINNHNSSSQDFIKKYYMMEGDPLIISEANTMDMRTKNYIVSHSQLQFDSIKDSLYQKQISEQMFNQKFDSLREKAHIIRGNNKYNDKFLTLNFNYDSKFAIIQNIKSFDEDKFRISRLNNFSINRSFHNYSLSTDLTRTSFQINSLSYLEQKLLSNQIKRNMYKEGLDKSNAEEMNNSLLERNSKGNSSNANSVNAKPINTHVSSSFFNNLYNNNIGTRSVNNNSLSKEKSKLESTNNQKIQNLKQNLFNNSRSNINNNENSDVNNSNFNKINNNLKDYFTSNNKNQSNQPIKINNFTKDLRQKLIQNKEEIKIKAKSYIFEINRGKLKSKLNRTLVNKNTHSFDNVYSDVIKDQLYSSKTKTAYNKYNNTDINANVYEMNRNLLEKSYKNSNNSKNSKNSISNSSNNNNIINRNTLDNKQNNVKSITKNDFKIDLNGILDKKYISNRSNIKNNTLIDNKIEGVSSRRRRYSDINLKEMIKKNSNNQILDLLKSESSQKIKILDFSKLNSKENTNKNSMSISKEELHSLPRDNSDIKIDNLDKNTNMIVMYDDFDKESQVANVEIISSKQISPLNIVSPYINDNNNKAFAEILENQFSIERDYNNDSNNAVSASRNNNEDYYKELNQSYSNKKEFFEVLKKENAESSEKEIMHSSGQNHSSNYNELLTASFSTKRMPNSDLNNYSTKKMFKLNNIPNLVTKPIVEQDSRNIENMNDENYKESQEYRKLHNNQSNDGFINIVPDNNNSNININSSNQENNDKQVRIINNIREREDINSIIIEENNEDTTQRRNYNKSANFNNYNVNFNITNQIHNKQHQSLYNNSKQIKTKIKMKPDLDTFNYKTKKTNDYSNAKYINNEYIAKIMTNTSSTINLFNNINPMKLTNFNNKSKINHQEFESKLKPIEVQTFIAPNNNNNNKQKKFKDSSEIFHLEAPVNYEENDKLSQFSYQSNTNNSSSIKQSHQKIDPQKFIENIFKVNNKDKVKETVKDSNINKDKNISENSKYKHSNLILNINQEGKNVKFVKVPERNSLDIVKDINFNKRTIITLENYLHSLQNLNSSLKDYSYLVYNSKNKTNSYVSHKIRALQYIQDAYLDFENIKRDSYTITSQLETYSIISSLMSFNFKFFDAENLSNFNFYEDYIDTLIKELEEIVSLANSKLNKEDRHSYRSKQLHNLEKVNQKLIESNLQITDRMHREKQGNEYSNTNKLTQEFTDYKLYLNNFIEPNNNSSKKQEVHNIRNRNKNGSNKNFNNLSDMNSINKAPIFNSNNISGFRSKQNSLYKSKLNQNSIQISNNYYDNISHAKNTNQKQSQMINVKQFRTLKK